MLNIPEGLTVVLETNFALDGHALAGRGGDGGGDDHWAADDHNGRLDIDGTIGAEEAISLDVDRRAAAVRAEAEEKVVAAGAEGHSEGKAVSRPHVIAAVEDGLGVIAPLDEAT